MYYVLYHTVVVSLHYFVRLGQAVKLLIALAVLFTYGLQLFVPMDIMWRAVKEKCSHKYQGLCHTVMRICISIFTSELLSFSNYIMYAVSPKIHCAECAIYLFLLCVKYTFHFNTLTDKQRQHAS